MLDGIDGVLMSGLCFVLVLWYELMSTAVSIPVIHEWYEIGPLMSSVEV